MLFISNILIWLFFIASVSFCISCISRVFALMFWKMIINSFLKVCLIISTSWLSEWLFIDFIFLCKLLRFYSYVKYFWIVSYTFWISCDMTLDLAKQSSNQLSSGHINFQWAMVSVSVQFQTIAVLFRFFAFVCHSGQWSTLCLVLKAPDILFWIRSMQT